MRGRGIRVPCARYLSFAESFPAPLLFLLFSRSFSLSVLSMMSTPTLDYFDTTAASVAEIMGEETFSLAPLDKLLNYYSTTLSLSLIHACISYKII